MDIKYDSIYNVKKLIQECKTLDRDIGDIESLLLRTRGDRWEEGIKNDTRKPVQILYSELMSLRAQKTTLELSYVYVLSNEDVQHLNTGEPVAISPSKPLENQPYSWG